ncbi:polyketide synthetase [Punctularia strigosozonata HHB-11173 SS5]|uniref:polyketide synthetase n=1 Tax=Punctularia strigosozonata (strain HHB-11173) TaxID=741275 RepID=UPI00044179DB|nr:polyketide synthetase [Punctularia strigosozonata HHB-11173 SS5]EIN06933.1 polyketide synthetase [Punctularia strigosozonata HHB-11173 SS5]
MSALALMSGLMSKKPATLVDAWIETCLSEECALLPMAECGPDSLTYQDMLSVCCILAEELERDYGPTPTVAILSENHPYVLAVILSVWLLGGIVAPLDHHAPDELISGMLTNIGPQCVVVPETDARVQKIARSHNIPLRAFALEGSTIPALIRQYGPKKLTPPPVHRPPENIGLYVFTSSASSVSNLKAVPLSHRSIYAGCISQLSWLRRNYPDNDFARLRVLGWSPWTHIMGSTELGGPLFHGRLVDCMDAGWRMEDKLIADAQLTLLDPQSDGRTTRGELLIRSRLISRGYLNHDSTAFRGDDEGYITFSTGDIYSFTDGRYTWEGRKEEYIQLLSGEQFDPRTIERQLDGSAGISRSCVVGDRFLGATSRHVCAIIEPDTGSGDRGDIMRAIGVINRDLPPPLRITPRRILILEGDERLPLTKKGMLFRKKLRRLYQDRLVDNFGQVAGRDKHNQQAPAMDDVRQTVITVISGILGVERDALEADQNCTFAELGMDSLMAVAAVNALNERFQLTLPLSTCHDHINVLALTTAVVGALAPHSALSHDIRASSRQYNQSSIEVVIVGQAVRLPGGLDTSHKLWQALIERRKDIMTPIPPHRWDHASFYCPTVEKPGDVTLDRAGFVDIESFDASFFGISASEALSVSPSVRLALETAFEAFENANIPVSQVKGSNMGVWVATGPDDGYSHLLFAEGGFNIYNRFYGQGIANSTACGRLSYLLDLHGPSVTIDTACSGGLVALDHAVQYLQSGDGDSALVCGVNTHVWPGILGFLSAQRMTSPGGRCATFTEEADGYVPSEGAVSLILKTRSAAVRDGDTILGVIKSTAVQHNGRTQGLIAPSAKSQVTLQRNVLSKAGLQPSDLHLVEAHGTGTRLGDIIEIQAINEVFAGSHELRSPLIVGAAKSCVGHTESVAGLVGVVKTLLSFKHRTVPGLVHLTEGNLNRGINCNAVPLRIPARTVSLRHDSGPSRGLVLAYGFAGTIAAAVLEQANEQRRAQGSAPQRPQYMIFAVSAKTGAALRDLIFKYISYLAHTPEEFFEDGLQVVHAFPGQGSQYPGMARALCAFSGYREIILEACAKASSLLSVDFRALLLEESQDTEHSLDSTDIAPVCIFLYQYAVSTWLQSIGISAQGVIGHSVGEIAASVVAGALSFEGAVRFIIARSAAMDHDTPERGAMAALFTSEETVKTLIRESDLTDEITISVYNSEQNHVVSGKRSALERLLRIAEASGVKNILLKVKQGFHSPCISFSLPAIQKWLANHEAELGSPSIPYYSSYLGGLVGHDQRLDTEFWVNHAAQPVRFSDAFRALRKASAPTVLVDVGPQPFILASSSTLDSISADKMVIGSCAKEGKDQTFAMLRALAVLHQQGVDVDFARLYSERGVAYLKTELPTYSWQKKWFYPSVRPSRNGHGQFTTLPVPTSLSDDRTIDAGLYELLDDHRIQGRRVLPGAALVALLALSPHNPAMALKSLQFHKPMIVEQVGDAVLMLFATNGSVSVTTRQSDDVICSGFAGEISESPYNRRNGQPATTSPARILNKKQIYSNFRETQFGNLFSSIQDGRIWSDRAEAHVTIHPSGDATSDLIRQLDACFHFFGALTTEFPPGVDGNEGAFLPSSVEGFKMNGRSLPAEFICRYRLPISTERKYKVMSTSFEVLSMEGEVLVSCQSYKVAWIPSSAIHPPLGNGSMQPRMFNWRYRFDTDSLASSSTDINHHARSPSFDVLIYRPTTSPGECRPSTTGLMSTWMPVVISPITDRPWGSQGWRILEEQAHEMHAMPCTEENLISKFASKQPLVVLDMTSLCEPSKYGVLVTTWVSVLQLLKLVSKGLIQIRGVVVISSECAYTEEQTPRPDSLPSQAPHILSDDNDIPLGGSAVQGMVRVLRRELGLDARVAWGIDIPANLDAAVIKELDYHIRNEVSARLNTTSGIRDSLVVYRRSAENNSWTRRRPVLSPIWPVPSEQRKLGTGGTIITGSGSIGLALATEIVKETVDAPSGIFVLGRRAESDRVIQRMLHDIGHPHKVQYIQADLADVAALTNTLKDLQNSERFGPINSIIHTAGTVRDSTIPSISREHFEGVIFPKVQGAWNLHVASLNAKLDVKSFVLLSSISVPLGTAGQLSYVAANSFMDSLAAYRNSMGLPGLSLQLGAWESQLTANMSFEKAAVKLVTHEEGIPIVLQIITRAQSNNGTPDGTMAVQGIAKLDLQQLATDGVADSDSLWDEVLKDVQTTRIGLRKEDITKEAIQKALWSSLDQCLGSSNDEPDWGCSLGSYGVDSIAFAQIRGALVEALSVEVPIKFLDDRYSLHDIIEHLLLTTNGEKQG